MVPEIASRNHIMKLPYIVDEALRQAGMGFADIDAVAVTDGPGLIGALLVGVSYAKALAHTIFRCRLFPCIILKGISARYTSRTRNLKPPFLCLVVSGGHTHIVVVEDYGRYRLLGKTRDDAVGEAFDKTARALGLGLPRRAAFGKACGAGDSRFMRIRAAFKGETHLDFTFSGLKTAVINQMHTMDQRGEPYNKADIAASFQTEAISFLARQHL